MIEEWWSLQSPRARRIWIVLGLALTLYSLHRVGGDPGFPIDR